MGLIVTPDLVRDTVRDGAGGAAGSIIKPGDPTFTLINNELADKGFLVTTTDDTGPRRTKERTREKTRGKTEPAPLNDLPLFAEAVGTLALSVWFLTTAMVGWSGRNLPMWDRVLRTVAGILVLGTEVWIWVPAALAIVALGANDWRLARQRSMA